MPEIYIQVVAHVCGHARDIALLGHAVALIKHLNGEFRNYPCLNNQVSQRLNGRDVAVESRLLLRRWSSQLGPLLQLVGHRHPSLAPRSPSSWSNQVAGVVEQSGRRLQESRFLAMAQCV
ncbi:hypothetical protein E2562_009699 [Oryza meyeriana var. granulata]|uniref:Uncharacterized protein n=1 Tax=Oryza meyeriana var. granulata TaxID=110450 RepID=A0A6G1D1Z0_9ORYZ|nr:hypothetical protein E2562_009699 [Oryza meyeriana var. granulata]